MITYYILFSDDEDSVMTREEFESVDETCSFINECLVERGEGEWQIQIAAFNVDDEAIEDEP